MMLPKYVELESCKNYWCCVGKYLHDRMQVQTELKDYALMTFYTQPKAKMQRKYVFLIDTLRQHSIFMYCMIGQL